MSIYTRAIAWGAVAIPAALLAAAPAAAQDPAQEDTVSVTASTHSPGSVTRATKVAYHDLDLSTARGQRKLLRRIDDAADAVCSDVGLWNRFAWQDQRQCLDSAVTTAMAQVRGTATGAN